MSSENWATVLTLQDGAQCVVLRESHYDLRYLFRLIMPDGGLIETYTVQCFDGSYVPSLAFEEEARPFLQKKAEKLYRQLCNLALLHEDQFVPGQKMQFANDQLEKFFNTEDDVD